MNNGGNGYMMVKTDLSVVISEQKVKYCRKSSLRKRPKVKFVFDIEVFVGFKTFSSKFLYHDRLFHSFTG